MLVTVSGSSMLVRDTHPENALLSILVTVSGSVMLLMPSQPKKAQDSMRLPPVTTTDFKPDGTASLLSAAVFAPKR